MIYIQNRYFLESDFMGEYTLQILVFMLIFVTYNALICYKLNQIIRNTSKHDLIIREVADEKKYNRIKQIVEKYGEQHEDGD